MIDTLKIFDELRDVMDANAAKKIAEIMVKVYEELKKAVTKEEFNELTKTVNELAITVKELAEAQKQTEQAVKELTEAQKRTEQAVKELTAAHKETEQEIKKLAKYIKDTRTHLGTLSDTVGYGLEGKAIQSLLLPGLLKRKYGIELISSLIRKPIRYDGRHDEINIYGIGRKAKKEIFIVGEAKSRLAKRHIDEFLGLVQRLEKNKIIKGEYFLLMVTYTTNLDIVEYANGKGINIIWSYEI